VNGCDRSWSTRQALLRTIKDKSFPYSYLLRNIQVLESESAWRSLPPRLRREALAKLVDERCAIFRELRNWVSPSSSPDERSATIEPKFTKDEYCDHCGQCCEIASGMGVFPDPRSIPDHWQETFRRGLGRYHRFCAFLQEGHRQGTSRCGIHPWRPIPCRIFEQEECDYLKSDPGFRSVNDNRLGPARRRLSRLMRRS
jgi:hypothetical protein